MRIGVPVMDFNDTSTNFQISIGIVWIGDDHCHPGVMSDILVLVPVFGCVHKNSVTIDIALDWRHLRRSIGPKCAQARVCALVE